MRVRVRVREKERERERKREREREREKRYHLHFLLTPRPNALKHFCGTLTEGNGYFYLPNSAKFRGKMLNMIGGFETIL